MRIRNIAAYRRQLQAEFNVNPDWYPDFMGSRATVDGRTVDGFFKFWQSSTGGGREPIAGKLRGVLEMAQNDQAIYEITQNAADCGATDLRLWYDEAHFLACNDGEAFDARDVKSILDTFGSEKALRQHAAQEGMIGQYGVGFKLFHRLVGRESGLEELLDKHAGPMIFSWSNREQLDRFLGEAREPWSADDAEGQVPWLFKILLTCFPTAPGEVVKDIGFGDVVAFTNEETETFRRWAAAKLGAHRPEQGSLFFLHLGEGKREVLDTHMGEIRSCMGVSLRFLRKLASITVNGDRIERVPLEAITLRIPAGELRSLGFREEHQDVELVFAYAEDKIERLAKEPTLYQYFPMTKEAHGMGYVIHSNGLQKQAQRTELNADSTINARLLERLAARVLEQAREWMHRDPEKYRALFKVILASAFEPCKLKVLHEKVQEPFIGFIREHVPTSDGQFLPADQVLISLSKVIIPLEEFGIERHWFHWRTDKDADIVSKARDNTRLGLKEASIGHLIRKVGPSRIGEWLGGLSNTDYDACLMELQEFKDGSTDLPDLAFIRIGGALVSLNQLLATPKLLGDLQEWYAEHPHLNEWLPPMDLELRVVNLAPERWNASTAALLFGLTTKEARNALIDRLPNLTVTAGATGSAAEHEFMHWWAAHMDELPNAIVRKKLVFKVGDEVHPWNEALVLEQIDVPLPTGTVIKLPLHRLVPTRTEHVTEQLTQLRDVLEQKGFDPDFLEMAFKRRKKQGKDELTGLGDRLTEAYKDEPLSNGSQLLFAVALGSLHTDWKGLEQLKLRAASGECFDASTWWCLTAPAFVSRNCVLHESYADIREYLNEHWDPIKFGGSGVLAASPRLGEVLSPDLVAEELDHEQRCSFLDWLMSQHRRSDAVLDQVRSEKYKPMLEAILGSNPGNWIIGPDALLLLEEQPPAWVMQWAGDEDARMAMLHVLGMRSSEDPVLLWREALLNDTEECAASLPSPPDQTLRWIVAKGGAETFVSERQEKRITDLVRSKGGTPGTALRLELELQARVSEDPVYVTWKTEGHGWTVLEYEGEQLPLELTWEGSALAMRHGVKAYAPSDGSQRIFITAGYPIMVALYLLSDGAEALVPAAVRDSFRTLHDREHSGSRKEENPKARSVEGLERKQQVEHFRERQFMFSKAPAITLDELINAVEWEYRRKLLDRENGQAFRFKEVEQLPDGVLVLRRPNVAELPYELTSDRDRTIHGMKLKLRKRGVAYQDITDFELLAGTEGEVRIRVKILPFALNESTVATIELPVEDMLMRTLTEAWHRIAQAHEPARPIIDLVKERAPGGQVGFIFGPPGTGKTTVLAERLMQSVRDTEAKVLVLTPTNTAADVLYERITEKASGDMKVLNGVHRFGSQNKDIPLDEGYPAVVITTMHRFTFDRFADGTGIRAVDWDHVVFDEASMAALPYALLPLLSLPNDRTASQWGALGARFLFAGDPFQLMPVGATPSIGDRLEAEKKEIVLRGFATDNIFTLAGIDRFSLEEAPALPGARIDRLAKNYRSGRSIVKAFSRTFYHDGVTSARNNDVHAITLGSELLPPIGLWSFPALVPEKGAPADDMLNPATIIPFEHSAVHVHSALLATRLAVVLATENPGKRVIIICPYVRQVRVCQTLLEPFNKDKSADDGPDEVKAVEVSSVHRYQGGEAEVVIFLLNPSASSKRADGRLVIGEIALFNDPHLINVAISRARDVLVLLAPEDELVDRGGRSGFFLMDRVLDGQGEGALQVEGRPSRELEELLFNGQALEERVSVLPIRAMDVYRVEETRARGTDLVVLHNKENLNLVMTQDILMEGIISS